MIFGYVIVPKKQIRELEAENAALKETLGAYQKSLEEVASIVEEETLRLKEKLPRALAKHRSFRDLFD